MVKGLISQFTTRVMIRPFGLSPTSFSVAKSTPIIIGQTMAQISSATGKLTLAYSIEERTPNTPGTTWPRPMPAAMAKATQTER